MGCATLQGVKQIIRNGHAGRVPGIVKYKILPR